MRLITTAVGLCLLSFGSMTLAWADGETYPLRREVLLPALKQTELISLTLDAAVYSDVLGDLTSLQLMTDSGVQVPFVLREGRITEIHTATRNWPVTNTTVTPLPGNGLEITMELADYEPEPEGVRIITPLKNFEQQVQVLASADGMDWKPIAKDALIFDYSQQMDVRNVQIPLPVGTERHFRVVIEDITAEQESQLQELIETLQGGEASKRTERPLIKRRPFQIDRIEFSHTVKTQLTAGEKKSNYPVASWQIVPGENKTQSVVEITSRFEPLTQFTLQTPVKNFSRQVSLQIADSASEGLSWRTLYSKNLSRIDFKNVQQENLSIQLPETRTDKYRLAIENKDSPPLEVTGVTAEGNVCTFVFLAGDKQKPQNTPAVYKLYGGESLPTVQYNTATIETLLQRGIVPLVATLGDSLSASDVPAPRALAWRDLVNNKPLLFSVIGLLVVALGWGLFKATKRVDALPKE